MFDEITNYLDIYQRLNSSKIIKEKIQDKTTLIVEHDLVIFDYLCDYIHLMYGKKAAYGTLTKIKSTKSGINEYLEGYSREENVRFRDKKITFEKNSINENKTNIQMLKWENDKVSFESFKLKINEGKINKQEIIGIIGQNALGKTTFIKHILEKSEEITLAYKPQFIETSEKQVIEELSKYKNFQDNFYQIYILNPLNIESLYEKKINELSGGELQKFSIAKTLLEEAQVYLLDEPTAFLDIEEKLKISQIIKNFILLKEKSALIIDHDLIFMDYISDKFLVFQGEPSIQGESLGPFDIRKGMNLFLEKLQITFRRDGQNKRPRINKEDSIKDKKQKKIKEYYYD